MAQVFDQDVETEVRLDEQLDHWRKVVELVASDPAFHTDPYSAAQTMCTIALKAALESPNIGAGAEYTSVERIMNEVRGM